MKSKNKTQFEGFACKSFQNYLSDSIENSLAILTHYIHNIDNGVAKYFKKDALQIVKKYKQFQEEEESDANIVKDPIQLLLFENKTIPFPTPEHYTFKFIDLF